jgi:hypothetical protein
MNLRDCGSGFNLSIRSAMRNDLCWTSFQKPKENRCPEILERAAEALRSVLRDGIGKAMSLHNEQRAKGTEQSEK